MWAVFTIAININAVGKCVWQINWKNLKNIQFINCFIKILNCIFGILFYQKVCMRLSEWCWVSILESMNFNYKISIFISYESLNLDNYNQEILITAKINSSYLYLLSSILYRFHLTIESELWTTTNEDNLLTAKTHSSYLSLRGHP